MPYDSRHISQDGNRTTTRKDLIAPRGKYRVVHVDTFDGSDVILLTTQSKDKAIKTAKQHSGDMSICYVYDSKGQNIFSAGTY